MRLPRSEGGAATEDVGDFDQLEKDLEKRRRILALAALYVGILFVIMALGVAFGYPGWVLWLFVAPAIVFVAIAIFGTRSWRVHQAAWSRLQEIVYEEWRTGEKVLPTAFPIHRWYGLFRTPPVLSEQELTRLRRAAWFGSSRSTLPLIVWTAIGLAAIFGSIVANWYFGADGWWPLVAFVTWFVPIVGVILWTWKGGDLLYHLRKYEEVTGRWILPDDLRKKA